VNSSLLYDEPKLKKFAGCKAYPPLRVWREKRRPVGTPLRGRRFFLPFKMVVQKSLGKGVLIMHIDIREYPIGDGFMKITIDIEEELLEKAAKLTGIREKNSLVKLGLETLITRESGKRLAKLGGTEEELESTRRR